MERTGTGCFEMPKGLVTLAGLFAAAGHELYAVGGMVRNPLLGLPVSDMDITSAMRPDAVKALLGAEDIPFIEKGAAFGTLEIRLAGERYEYACFRSDRYLEGGAHRPESVRFSDAPEDDAVRRDFTVNALYLGVLSKRITDPTGGLRDLKRRVIRATSKDPAVILQDDGLRILRMVRFGAELGFTIDRATLAAAKRYVGGLCDISPERIREELDKILLSDIRYARFIGETEDPRARVLGALITLRDIGALDVVIPELTKGRGVMQDEEYHAFDVLDHNLSAAAHVRPELRLRLAALLHDVGKPEAFAQNSNMHGHEKIGAGIAKEILSRLRYPNDLRGKVATLIEFHMYDLDAKAREKTLRKRFVELGREAVYDLADLRDADIWGSGRSRGAPSYTGERWRELIERMKREGVPFSEAELACTGADIMAWTGLPPSKRIGSIKRALLMHCALKPEDNALDRLRKLTLELIRGQQA